ncbi:MAG: Lar family restriction alleviation protein [Oscillospiraceae bacterium]|nr:Lar family restriction alleviation protein [Oscillospiraceae bacterium]
MENKPMIELEDCPICRGTGMLMHEGGWSVQVECADCSAHTVYVEYRSDAEIPEAESKVAALWNMGKVIHSERGE